MPPSDTAVSITRGRAWVLAARPKTLPAAIAPVVVGAAAALGERVFSLFPALAALAGALLLQIGVNLANDYFDFGAGIDAPDRKGPVRVTQAGLIPPEQVRLGMVASLRRGGSRRRLPRRPRRGADPDRRDRLDPLRARLQRRAVAAGVAWRRRFLRLRLLRPRGGLRHLFRAGRHDLRHGGGGFDRAGTADHGDSRREQPARHRDRRAGGQAHPRRAPRRARLPRRIPAAARDPLSHPAGLSRGRGARPADSAARCSRCRWRCRS